MGKGISPSEAIGLLACIRGIGKQNKNKAYSDPTPYDPISTKVIVDAGIYKKFFTKIN